MRVGSAAGRLIIGRGGQWFDVEAASNGRFKSDIGAIYDRWEEFRSWAAANLPSLPTNTAVEVDESKFDVPVPNPRQIMAIGLNYREHAAESQMDEPDYPVVFTKYVSSLVGHGASVNLPSDGIDWEVELVVVIGQEGHRISVEKAWDHVAGVTVGQDLSWRQVQHRGPVPQFAISKSYPGFSPVGPFVVTPDELPNKDDLGVSCALNGEKLQDGRTSDLIFPVPELIAYLSGVLTLLPGDIIFTGTPSGVGAGRKPARFLEAGELVSTVEGVGDLAVNLVR
jgi:2,4-didehydro-3-deoxy-L-rhamnonate hydrolase